MSEYIFLFTKCLLPFIIIAVVSYLIGCVNSSIVVTKILKSGSDIRDMGSGNAGFTNVLRTMGKRMAILTFIGDFSKGVVAVWFGRWFASVWFGNSANDTSILQYGAYIAGLMCILGHIYPCFFKFKGGKGVLTAWSITLLIDWRVFLIIIGVFIVVLLFTKIASVASLAAAVSYPIATFLTSYLTDYRVTHNINNVLLPTITSLIISMIIIYRHKNNISRILQGTEKKISVHKKV